jgi:hypothetical protein
MSEALREGPAVSEHDDGPGVAALLAFLEAENDHDEDSDLEPEVITGDDRHYFVRFTLGSGRGPRYAQPLLDVLASFDFRKYRAYLNKNSTVALQRNTWIDQRKYLRRGADSLGFAGCRPRAWLPRGWLADADQPARAITRWSHQSRAGCV